VRHQFCSEVGIAFYELYFATASGIKVLLCTSQWNRNFVLQQPNGIAVILFGRFQPSVLQNPYFWLPIAREILAPCLKNIPMEK
jgi:hypothetical protein